MRIDMLGFVSRTSTESSLLPFSCNPCHDLDTWMHPYPCTIRHWTMIWLDMYIGFMHQTMNDQTSGYIQLKMAHLHFSLLGVQNLKWPLESKLHPLPSLLILLSSPALTIRHLILCVHVCLLLNNDASRKTEIDTALPTSSQGVFLCLPWFTLLCCQHTPSLF